MHKLRFYQQHKLCRLFLIMNTHFILIGYFDVNINPVKNAFLILIIINRWKYCKKLFLILIAVTCRTLPGILGITSFWFLAGKAKKCQPTFSVARKATILWPGVPQNPGLDQAYQAFPGHAFLASLAWPGLPCF